MRRTSEILLLAALTVAASGCDYVRMLAGRPTSADIEAKRELIEIERLRRQVEADSAAAAALNQEELPDVAETLPDAVKTPKPGYYVVIGMFSDEANVDRLRAAMMREGVTPVVFQYTDRLVAVTLEPAADLSLAKDRRDWAGQFSFCPKDTWILELK